MDTASLRIKFTPLLKKISRRGDPDSKCCIEIVPELSAFQNLEKLNWKLEDKLIEYTIPMTYKIIIKKQDQIKNGSDNKVYHSCVDLLHSYSISNTNFASGDVMRITSDNVFLKRIASSNDSAGILLTKDLINAKDLFENIVSRKTTSIQTLHIYEPESSSCSQRPLLVDKSLDIDIHNFEPQIKSNDLIIPVDSSSELNNNERETRNNFAQVEEEIIIEDDIKSEDIDAHLYGNHVERSRRLTLSPICSINTYDLLPKGTEYNKKASNYTVYSNYSSDKTEMEVDTNYTDASQEIMNNLIYNTSDKLQNLYKSQATVATAKHFDNCHRTGKQVRVKTEASHNIITVQNVTPFAKPSAPAKPNQNTEIEQNNTTKLCFLEPQNNFRVAKVNVVDVFNNKLKLGNNSFSGQNKECDDANTRDVFVEQNEKTICNVDYNNKTKPRVLPEVRIAKFVQNLEREIYPLKLMLNDIKCKCVTLGLNCGEYIPTTKPTSMIYNPMPHHAEYITPTNTTNLYYTTIQNCGEFHPAKNRSIIYKPMPNCGELIPPTKSRSITYKTITNCGEYIPPTQTKSLAYKTRPNYENNNNNNSKIIKETCKKTRQSNRVVYTILFNG